MAVTITGAAFEKVLETLSETMTPPPGAKPAAEMFIDPEAPALKPHVDPYEAAKEIRVLARELVDNTESGNSESSQAFLSYAQTSWNDEEYWAKRIREAAKTRRTSSVLEALSGLNFCRNITRTRIQEAKDYMPGSVNSNAKKTAEQIHKLAQSLPTVATAPVLPVDQVLRGIATLLKNAGYFDEKGKPVKP